MNGTGMQWIRVSAGLALVAVLAGGCVVRRTAPRNSDVMDLSDVHPSSSLNEPMPEPTAPPAIEPLTTTTPPALEPAPPSDPVRAAQTHTIAAGDTMWSLAVKYYGDGKQWPKIVEANPGLTPERMPIGKKIVIP